MVDELHAQSSVLERDLNLPQVIVAGDRPTAAASLIEALIGVVYPETNDKVGAALPTHVVLRYSEQEEVNVFVERSVGRNGSGTGADSPPARRNAQLSLPSPATADAGALEWRPDERGISPEEILGIKLLSDDRPDFSFVHVPHLGSDASHRRYRNPPIAPHSRNPHGAVFILVTSTGVGEAARLAAAQYARKCDPRGRRTLLVLTAPRARGDNDPAWNPPGPHGDLHVEPETGVEWQPEIYRLDPSLDNTAQAAVRADVVTWATRLVVAELDALTYYVEQNALRCEQMLERLDERSRAELVCVVKEISEMLVAATHELCQVVRLEYDPFIRSLHHQGEEQLQHIPFQRPQRQSCLWDRQPLWTNVDLMQDPVFPEPVPLEHFTELYSQCADKLVNLIELFLERVWAMAERMVDVTLHGFPGGDLVTINAIREHIVTPAMGNLHGGVRGMARQIMDSFRAASAMTYDVYFKELMLKWKNMQFRKAMSQSFQAERRHSPHLSVDVEDWLAHRAACPVLLMDVRSYLRIYFQAKIDKVVNGLIPLVIEHGILEKLPSILTATDVKSLPDEIIAAVSLRRRIGGQSRIAVAGELSNMSAAQTILSKLPTPSEGNDDVEDLKVDDLDRTADAGIMETTVTARAENEEGDGSNSSFAGHEENMSFEIISHPQPPLVPKAAAEDDARRSPSPLSLSGDDVKPRHASTSI
ncbi:uncharacterized protein PV07_12789 [Cladophialophora immunda]|uniref:GED domain-containing protein n=1 Tax=Cladophialophora immunda TaxID=569365 RepID=A0A0D2BRT8_9EURO|nr:uncharacterized protein PV07_12789 [Cladophialophora immunda]KIW21783.1 hypothetical protein PV07_12789 [Cladophialophora immunda]